MTLDISPWSAVRCAMASAVIVGSLRSDASVSLWRMDGSAAKKREREPGEADDDEGAASTAKCLPCVAERVPCTKSRRDDEGCEDGD